MCGPALWWYVGPRGAGGTMGQVLHGSATTTEAGRRAIQARQESVRAAAKRFGISPTTVQKGRRRQTTADARLGPKEPRSTVLTVEEEAVVVAFRRHTLLPLDDCLYALQPTIPPLRRSSLHRCLQRHGIARLPDVECAEPKRSRFKAYPIGYFHLDIAEVHTEQGRLHLFVATDRTSKLAFARLHEKATRPPDRGGLPARPRRGRALQGPHGADRQWHALHRSVGRRLDARGHQGDAGREGIVPLPRLRGGLRRSRDRAPPDQAAPSLDERPSRADEPHPQGRHRQALPLRQPR